MRKKPLVLLTGGSGMVGRNILEHPLADNFSFVAPTHAELDLLDFSRVNAFVAKEFPDFVVHAAGRVGGIQANLAEPVNFLVENSDMGRNVLIASRNAGIKKLINLSSSCMYPREAQNPLSEDSILKGELEPTNEGYAISKIYTLRLGQYINRENRLFQYKTFIPCNLYGRFDKFDPIHSHLIPAIIHKIHLAKTQNQKEVEIWGDGSARREFMYSGDLAEAILKALTTFESVPTLMNVGLGKDYSINEYYTAVARIIGWQGKFLYDLSRPVGMKQKLVSISRQEEWGWYPTTVLEDGIKKTYDFYLKGNK